jgi:hypothetical protein
MVNVMTLIPIEDYILRREAYCYEDRDCTFEILQTGNLPFVGRFQGIFPGLVPVSFSNGINLRKFEIIAQSVFQDCRAADDGNAFTGAHLKNIKAVTCAIVHWKMASQGGRAQLNVVNVSSKWRTDTYKQLLLAYAQRNILMFRIDGVRIPTASTFMRFLYPESFGIMDSRVVKITQKKNITALNLRADGYINDLTTNIRQYINNYNPFLVSEAEAINNDSGQFNDYDKNGIRIVSGFRPCDVEMAIF